MGVGSRGLKEALRTPLPRFRFLGKVVFNSVPSQGLSMCDVEGAHDLLFSPNCSLFPTMAGAVDNSKSHEHPFAPRRQAFPKAAARHPESIVFLPFRVSLLNHVVQGGLISRLVLVGMGIIHLCPYVFGIIDRLPHLWILLNCVFSCGMYILFWIWVTRRML